MQINLMWKLNFKVNGSNMESIDAKIKLNFKTSEIKEMDLIEEEIKKIESQNGIISLNFNPHEIGHYLLDINYSFSDVHRAPLTFFLNLHT